MELKLLNDQGQSAATVAAADTVFGRDFNEALVHQIVVAFQANARSGNRAQKSRGEVAKSTRKPYRQKGTGRARAGMASSPVWRGGGRAFPNSPAENFSQKVNRKMYRAAVAVILSQLVREERLSVIEDLVIDAPKTKVLADQVKRWNLNAPLLVITDDVTEALWLSSRNLVDVDVADPHETSPYALLRFKQVLLTKAALADIEEMLG